MRDRFFRHTQSLHREFFKNTKVGDLISALTTDTENMRMMVAIGGLMAIDATINFILFPILLWNLNPSLTLMVVPPLIIISILAVTLSSRLENGFMKIQELTAELSARAFEMCAGVRVIKAFRKEKEVHDEYVSRSKALRDVSIDVAKYQSLFLPGLDFALGLALCIVLVVGGLRVIDGKMPLSNLVAFQLYLAHMDWPMMCIGWFIQMYRQSRASQKRVQNFGDARNPLQPISSSVKTSTQLFSIENISLG
jgi:ATP-binding cassette subfamily B protein